MTSTSERPEGTSTNGRLVGFLAPLALALLALVLFREHVLRLRTYLGVFRTRHARSTSSVSAGMRAWRAAALGPTERRARRLRPEAPHRDRRDEQLVNGSRRGRERRGGRHHRGSVGLSGSTARDFPTTRTRASSSTTRRGEPSAPRSPSTTRAISSSAVRGPTSPRCGRSAFTPPTSAGHLTTQPRLRDRGDDGGPGAPAGGDRRATRPGPAVLDPRVLALFCALVMLACSPKLHGARPPPAGDAPAGVHPRRAQRGPRDLRPAATAPARRDPAPA